MLSESPPSGAPRPIAASLARSASSRRASSTSLTSTSTSLRSLPSLLRPSQFHSSPSTQQQIEDVVRDPLPSSPESSNSKAAADAAPFPRLDDDAFLSLAAVRAATRGPLSVYASRRKAGLYRKDPRQESAMLELQRLFDDLEASAAPSTGLTMMEAIGDGGGGGGSWLSSLFGGADPSSSSPPSSALSSPRGLYMYGGVGTGKTMLMDVFSECAAPLVPVSFCFFFELFSLFVATGGKNPALFPFSSLPFFLFPQ